MVSSPSSVAWLCERMDKSLKKTESLVFVELICKYVGVDRVKGRGWKEREGWEKSREEWEGSRERERWGEGRKKEEGEMEPLVQPPPTLMFVIPKCIKLVPLNLVWGTSMYS